MLLKEGADLGKSGLCLGEGLALGFNTAVAAENSGVIAMAKQLADV